MFACGKDFSLIVTESHDGNIVIGCGNNENYSLGLPELTKIDTPRKIGSMTGVIMVSAGLDHSLALDINGDVWGWGSNAHFKLGFPDESEIVKTPTKLPLKNIIKISCGEYISLALDRGGNVWWAGVFDDSLPSEFTVVASLPNIIDIVAGDIFGLILTSYNEVFEIDSDGVYYDITAKNIVKIGCNNNIRIALTNESKVYIWGDNTLGGFGPEIPIGTYQFPILHPKFSNIINVSRGLGPTHLINNEYQVIKLTSRPSYISTLLPKIWTPFSSNTISKNKYIDIACGGTEQNYHVMTQNFNQSICGWGDNNYYQLAANYPSSIDSSSPICITYFLVDAPQEDPANFIREELGLDTNQQRYYFQLAQNQARNLAPPTKSARRY